MRRVRQLTLGRARSPLPDAEAEVGDRSPPVHGGATICSEGGFFRPLDAPHPSRAVALTQHLAAGLDPLAEGPARQDDAPTSGDSRAGNRDALTAWELEVLRLIAGGLTNREIAEELVVSIKTPREGDDAHAMDNGRRSSYPKIGRMPEAQIETSPFLL